MDDDKQKAIFSRNLNRYLSLSDKTQKEVSDAIGVLPQTFNTWCQGNALPRMGKVQALADYFHIEKTDLIDEHPTGMQKTKGFKINVVGRVAAGIPIEAIENIIDTEEIPAEMARSGEYFGLRIQGDSMEPIICNGDTVIVRRQDDAESGEIVIALINSDDGVCKKLKKYDNGIGLLSLNPQYEPLYFRNSDIDTLPVCIIGKVVELRRKM